MSRRGEAAPPVLTTRSLRSLWRFNLTYEWPA
jgi:hypothetical protein